MDQKNLRRLHGEGLLPESVFRTFLIDSDPPEGPRPQGIIDRAEAVSRQVDILRSTGELSPSEVEAIAIRLQEYAEEAAKPVLFRVLLGLAGWAVAAFLALSIEFVLHGRGLLPSGLALLGSAAALSRTTNGIFRSQLVLALVVAGNIGLLTAFSPDVGEDLPAVMPLLQFILCLTIYPLFPNAVFRFAAPVSVAVLAVFWIADREGAFWLFHLLVGVEVFLYLALVLRMRRLPAFFPLERAMGLLLPATLLAVQLVRMSPRAALPASPLWPSGLLLGGALIVLLLHPDFGLPPLSRPWEFGLSAALPLGLFSSPGIIGALILLVLGRACADRYLSVLGGLFLPVFLALGFHAALHVDITREAWVIAGGGLLLWVRCSEGRRPPGVI